MQTRLIVSDLSIQHRSQNEKKRKIQKTAQVCNPRSRGQTWCSWLAFSQLSGVEFWIHLRELFLRHILTVKSISNQMESKSIKSLNSPWIICFRTCKTRLVSGSKKVEKSKNKRTRQVSKWDVSTVRYFGQMFMNTNIKPDTSCWFPQGDGNMKANEIGLRSSFLGGF